MLQHRSAAVHVDLRSKTLGPNLSGGIGGTKAASPRLAPP
ncbi:unnamed protein product [Ectocarpus fasciculatus]